MEPSFEVEGLAPEAKVFLKLALTEACFRAGGASKNRDPPLPPPPPPPDPCGGGGDSHKFLSDPLPPPSMWWFTFNKWRASAPLPINITV